MKKELRAVMKRRNLALTLAERAAAASDIFARVELLPQFAAAHTVALFCALDDEPPTAEVLGRWSEFKKIVVPRVEGDVMRFYYYDPAAMCCGVFGIPEPGSEARVCEPAQIDLAVVPGTAFTASGERMGRGKGYYDRYFAQGAVYKVGVCYAHQVVADLWVEPHDVAMDCVVAG